MSNPRRILTLTQKSDQPDISWNQTKRFQKIKETEKKPDNNKEKNYRPFQFLVSGVWSEFPPKLRSSIHLNRPLIRRYGGHWTETESEPDK